MSSISPPSPPLRVLVVEDQYFVAIDCEQTLQQAGFDCVGLATTADEALSLAQGKRPDLILMDIRLANGSDGIAAALEAFRHLGIRSLFVSGHADAVLRRQAEPAHPLGWLDKPYTSGALLGAIAQAVEQLQPAAQMQR